jgi:hypothetical protein
MKTYKGDTLRLEGKFNLVDIVDALVDKYNREGMLDFILSLDQYMEDLEFTTELINTLQKSLGPILEGEHKDDYKVRQTVEFLRATLDETDIALVKALL